jgi:hypothetical protein
MEVIFVEHERISPVFKVLALTRRKRLWLAPAAIEFADMAAISIERLDQSGFEIGQLRWS